MENERKYFRLDNRFAVTCRKLRSDDESRSGLTQNLSFGGLLVAMDEPYKAGDWLEMEISMNTKEPSLKAIVLVVRAEGKEMALKLLGAGDNEGTRLYDFISAHSSLFENSEIKPDHG